MKLTTVFFLKEAKCPSCGSSGAYHGFNSIECPNKDCRHFDPNTDPNVNEPSSTNNTQSGNVNLSLTMKETAIILDAAGQYKTTHRGTQRSIIPPWGTMDEVDKLIKQLNDYYYNHGQPTRFQSTTLTVPQLDISISQEVKKQILRYLEQYKNSIFSVANLPDLEKETEDLIKKIEKQ